MTEALLVLKIGTVCALKSGGPRMVTTETKPTWSTASSHVTIAMIPVMWHANGSIWRDEVPLEALDIHEPT